MFSNYSAFKDFFGGYASMIFGQYSSPAFLLAFGLAFALFFYIVPKKYKRIFVTFGSLVFILLASDLVLFGFFCVLISSIFLCSRLEFKLKELVFWFCVSSLIISPIIFFQAWGIYSAFFPFAAYYAVYRTIHYYIDVKEGSLQKEGFLDYLHFIFFFPAFSNGPVERYENLASSGAKKEDVLFGLKKIGIGILKYLSIVYVFSKVVSVPFSSSGFWEWMLFTAYLGAIKIYVLFSGNIDLVIGIGALMGYRISENFPKVPYLQESLTKFWQNWQATIVNWLTAYVYFPLCRNRKNIYLKTMLIIMIIGWAHIFYTPEIIMFENYSQLVSYAVYYTLWGVFLGGALALSKLFDKKKAELKGKLESGKFTSFLYSNGPFARFLSVLITFTIIAIGWQNPLYILISSIA